MREKRRKEYEKELGGKKDVSVLSEDNPDCEHQAK